MRTAGFLRSLFLMGNALLVLGVLSVPGLLAVTVSLAVGEDSARLSLEGEDGITCVVESPGSIFKADPCYHSLPGPALDKNNDRRPSFDMVGFIRRAFSSTRRRTRLVRAPPMISTVHAVRVCG